MEIRICFTGGNVNFWEPPVKRHDGRWTAGLYFNIPCLSGDRRVLAERRQLSWEDTSGYLKNFYLATSDLGV